MSKPHEHLWTAATTYQIAPGIPGSVCATCGAVPSFLDDGRKPRWHRYFGDHDCWAAGCDQQAVAPVSKT